jgi:hypothetical protein
MTKPRLFYYEPKFVRDTLRAARDKALALQQAEKELIEALYEVDQRRFYVRLGYRSLRTFLIEGLKFTRTQAQRITTEVRRMQTTSEMRRIQTTSHIGPEVGAISTRYANYFKSRGRWDE